jgi:hypothetical protein
MILGKLQLLGLVRINTKLQVQYRSAFLGVYKGKTTATLHTMKELQQVVSLVK